MNLKTIHNVYLIGIGGIGMSALARYFKSISKHVSGYDKKATPLTKALEYLGINIHFKDDTALVADTFKAKNNTLIIYTPAIPNTHKELNYFRSNGFQVMKRSLVLGIITKDTFCFAVAGTHGKTTTTSILGHLLYQNKIKLTAFLGGISENYNSNLILNGNEVSVVEADEFDRSFLTLSPNFACITSMDADHLDIYGDATKLNTSFKEFSQNIKPNGKLFVKNGLSIKGITYGIDDDADYVANNIKIENGSYVFNIKTPDTEIHGLKFNLPGRHNLSNALIAMAMALEYGVPHQQLSVSLATYTGVKRRFTYHIKTKDFVFIDDYAHHPEEINAVYNAIREMYPQKSILVVFQPHLYSRTRDFVDEFAKSLAQFNKILLLDIYPARELPIKGVNAQWLLSKINNTNKSLVTKENLVPEIRKSNAQILLTIGAGDIGEDVIRIKKELSIAS